MNNNPNPFDNIIQQRSRPLKTSQDRTVQDRSISSVIFKDSIEEWNKKLLKIVLWSPRNQKAWGGFLSKTKSVWWKNKRRNPEQSKSLPTLLHFTSNSSPSTLASCSLIRMVDLALSTVASHQGCFGVSAAWALSMCSAVCFCSWLCHKLSYAWVVFRQYNWYLSCMFSVISVSFLCSHLFVLLSLHSKRTRYKIIYCVKTR